MVVQLLLLPVSLERFWLYLVVWLLRGRVSVFALGEEVLIFWGAAYCCSLGRLAGRALVFSATSSSMTSP